MLYLPQQQSLSSHLGSASEKGKKKHKTHHLLLAEAAEHNHDVRGGGKPAAPLPH